MTVGIGGSPSEGWNVTSTLALWEEAILQETEAGPILCWERQVDGALVMLRQGWEHELTLVRGIGPVMARRLQEAGYRDLAALSRHPRFGPAAEAVRVALAVGDVKVLRRAGMPPEGLVSFFPATSIAFLDIETVGLARVQPVFLAGVLLWRSEGWKLYQWLARTFDEEEALLRALLTALGGVQVLVTYNGRAFDEPHIAARLAIHRCVPPRFACHLDLLAVARRRLTTHRATGQLPNLRLRTLAGVLLGQDRSGDVDGLLVPDLYWAFVRTQDARLMAPVVAHNAADVLSLPQLMVKLGLAQGHLTVPVLRAWPGAGEMTVP